MLRAVPSGRSPRPREIGARDRDVLGFVEMLVDIVIPAPRLDQPPTLALQPMADFQIIKLEGARRHVKR
ncbi:hypothetical protein [Methylobacterium sp. AMS5]|uniref:hypothetical protein n=1 Tax=Methylobacterium sp. AMS5 TaxID=925818 RepID=UPI0011874D67|nr:hypothetical protein [Methylobacterium sp. AMS5]